MPGLHRRSQDQALPEPALADPSLSDSGGWLRWRAAARTADPIECREVLGVGIGEVWRYLWVVVIWAWSIRPVLSLSLSHVGGREHLPVEWIPARLVGRYGPVRACAGNAGDTRRRGALVSCRIAGHAEVGLWLDAQIMADFVERPTSRKPGLASMASS